MYRIHFICLFLLYLNRDAAAWVSQPVKEKTDTTINLKNPGSIGSRKFLVAGVSLTGLTSSFILLNDAWYKGYPRTPLHSFDDSKEWLQMDKMGHAWTTYNSSLLACKAWSWAGVSKSTALVLGSLTSLSYLTAIEYLDGRSAKWGWSWSDMAANLSGVAAFVSQEIFAGEQRIRIKFSSRKEKYLNELLPRANELFGTSLGSRILKDYNGQTYWLSINVNSWMNKKMNPNWLNIAIGTGAQGMLGGFDNRSFDNDGHLVFDRTDIRRFRQWYLSLDVDLSKIKTNRKAVRTLLDALNILKIPFPTLEYSRNGLKGHLLHF